MTWTRLRSAGGLAALLWTTGWAAPRPAAADDEVHSSTGLPITLHDRTEGNLITCTSGPFSRCSASLASAIRTYRRDNTEAAEASLSELMRSAGGDGGPIWFFMQGRPPRRQLYLMHASSNDTTTSYQYWPVQGNMYSDGTPRITQSTVSVRTYGSGATAEPVVEYYGTAETGNREGLTHVGMRTFVYHSSTTRVISDYYMERREDGDRENWLHQGFLRSPQGLANFLGTMGIAAALQKHENVRTAMSTWVAQADRQVVASRNRDGTSFEIKFQSRGPRGWVDAGSARIDGDDRESLALDTETLRLPRERRE